MLTGQATTCPPGEPDDFVLTDPGDTRDLGDGLSVERLVRPSSFAGDLFFGITADGKPYGPFFIEDGGSHLFAATLDPHRVDHPVCVVCNGEWDTFDEARNVGVERVIGKPVSLGRLVAVVEELAASDGRIETRYGV